MALRGAGLLEPLVAVIRRGEDETPERPHRGHASVGETCPAES